MRQNWLICKMCSVWYLQFSNSMQRWISSYLGLLTDTTSPGRSRVVPCNRDECGLSLSLQSKDLTHAEVQTCKGVLHEEAVYKGTRCCSTVGLLIRKRDLIPQKPINIYCSEIISCCGKSSPGDWKLPRKCFQKKTRETIRQSHRGKRTYIYRRLTGGLPGGYITRRAPTGESLMAFISYIYIYSIVRNRR